MGSFLKTAFMLICIVAVKSVTAQENMLIVKGGTYIPLYGVDSTAVTIDDFSMDVYPVTNADYLEFVREFPAWQKSKVKSLFADGSYLAYWESDLSFGDQLSANAPVTNISWFAAKKFCQCQGKRLPTIDEWEYAAMADEKTADARKKESYNQKILDWYSV